MATRASPQPAGCGIGEIGVAQVDHGDRAATRPLVGTGVTNLDDLAQQQSLRSCRIRRPWRAMPADGVGPLPATLRSVAQNVGAGPA